MPELEETLILLCGPHGVIRNKARDVNTLHTAPGCHSGFPGLVVTSGSSDSFCGKGPVLERLRHVPPGSMPNLNLFGKPQNGWGKHLSPSILWWDFEDSQRHHLGCASSHMTMGIVHGPSNSSNLSSENEIARPSNQGCGEDEL